MEKKNQSRRKFIGALATTGATAGLALMASPLKANFKPASSTLKNMSNKAMAITAEEWMKKLQDKKIPVVYDMHEHKDFWAGIWSNIYLMTNADVKDVGVAIVMRHGGFPFALNDQMWSKYKLGEFFKITDKNTNEYSVRNMYWEPTGKDYPLPGLDGIKALQQKGVAFCVCNMAIAVYGGFIAAAKGLTADEVIKDMLANVLPGVQVVPSGVWALGRFQQAPLSYGYINAG